MIEHNTLSENRGYDGGNAISDSQAMILDNVFYKNTSTRGTLYACHSLIKGNILTENSRTLNGCNGSIRDNIIKGSSGPAIDGCNGNIINNVIEDGTGSGIEDCNGLIENNIIRNNNSADLDSQLYLSSTPTYSCIADWTEGGDGNISNDPLFVDAENGDFHLQTGSPCIDAGDPSSTANDACFPPGMGTPRNDMGAYGGPYNCKWEIPVLKSALADLTQYGDVWAADNIGVPPFQSPSRRGWLGFRFDPDNHWYPVKGNADAYGIEDVIQVTQYGDVWVARSSETEYGPATRWGWLGFHYSPYDGWYPMCGDVNGDGLDDLIQITPWGEAWISMSMGDSFDDPEHWGWLGFLFDREKGYLPFYLDY